MPLFKQFISFIISYTTHRETRGEAFVIKKKEVNETCLRLRNSHKMNECKPNTEKNHYTHFKLEKIENKDNVEPYTRADLPLLTSRQSMVVVGVTPLPLDWASTGNNY